MGSRQKIGSVRPRSLGIGSVVIALLLQGNVAHPAIREHDASRRDGPFDEADQGIPGDILHHTQSDPA